MDIRTIPPGKIGSAVLPSSPMTAPKIRERESEADVQMYMGLLSFLSLKQILKPISQLYEFSLYDAGWQIPCPQPKILFKLSRSLTPHVCPRLFNSSAFVIIIFFIVFASLSRNPRIRLFSPFCAQFAVFSCVYTP